MPMRLRVVVAGADLRPSLQWRMGSKLYWASPPTSAFFQLLRISLRIHHNDSAPCCLPGNPQKQGADRCVPLTAQAGES